MPPQSILPPKDAEDALFWLQLFGSPRVGPKTFFRLLDEFGDADSAREALPGIAESAGLKKYELAPMDAVRREYKAGVRFGASLIAFGSPAYPVHLRDVDDAPPLIWACGHTDLLRRSSIAIVGSRNASSLGQRMTRAPPWQDLLLLFSILSFWILTVSTLLSSLFSSVTALLYRGLCQELVQGAILYSFIYRSALPMCRHGARASLRGRRVAVS